MNAYGEGYSRNPYNMEIAMEHLRRLDFYLALPLVLGWYVYTSFWLSKLAKRVNLAPSLQMLCNAISTIILRHICKKARA